MLTEDLPGTGGIIKESLEDFFVDEVPSYLPCGEGEHLMVHVEKRGLNTEDVAQSLAKAVGMQARNVGFAGRKDKYAVTRQWFSLSGPDARGKLDGFDAEGITILEAELHTNKLRTGHLKGNLFRIVLRGVTDDAEARAAAIIERINEQGLPNSFGPQRFGRNLGNVAVAMRWLNGDIKPPRNKGRRKLLISALQALLFNRTVKKRLEMGALQRPLDGDILKRLDTGGMFLAPEAEVEQSRVLNRELSPTGPIFGTKMWWPESDALELEEGVLAEAGLERASLDAFKRSGRGTRRLLRIFPENLDVLQKDDTLILSFGLDSGAFATTLLAEITKADELRCPDSFETLSFHDQTDHHRQDG